MLSPVPHFNDFAALMAASHSAMSLRIGSVAARLNKLVRRLAKFSFPSVAQPLAGLLTRPENHPASVRLEALIHLAALACRGGSAPTLAQLREWLNGILADDLIAELEDPVEDVFVSNLATWFGNARLFEGGWIDNDYYVQTCLKALTFLRERPWTRRARVHVAALLRLGEAVAARAGLPRYTLSEGLPRRPIRVASATVEPGRAHVSFTEEEIDALGFPPDALNPFVFEPQHARALSDETLGHTSLERRPLVRSGPLTIVALPTAIGAAVRRYVIESATLAGDLDALQGAVARIQFNDVFHLGRSGWGIDVDDPSQQRNEAGVVDFVGRFDEGGYVHVVFAPDDLSAIAHDGLQGLHSVEGAIDQWIAERTETLAARSDYRCGLTLLIHGGVGRGFSAGFGEAPPRWQRLGLSLPEFMRLSWDTETTALRIWKLLDQEDALRERGVHISNVNGFANLYAYARDNDFNLVPDKMALGVIGLATNFLTPMRHELRLALDQHVALAPNRESWVEVQRGTTSAFFSEMERLPVFVSLNEAARGVLLACVETATRPWWVQCDDNPSDERHRSIVHQIWEMCRNWLLPLAPVLEGRLPDLPAAPVGFVLRFPNISTYDETVAFSGEPPSAPAIELSDGGIVISCPPSYLRAFASPRNTGDRMMIMALIEGAFALAGVEPDPAAVGMICDDVVGSDEARFFHTIPARGLQEAIYAATPLPKPRLQSPEDRAWSHLGLATEAGWNNPPGPVPESLAGQLLNRAVNAVWKRIKARLLTLDRGSVIERVLINHDAIVRDRATWQMTAAALLSLHKNTADVLRAANDREGHRAVSAVACRVIAEMALCTSPSEGGHACSAIDLDYLVAEVGTLLDCAGQSDALRHGLATRAPIVHANGSFDFDGTFGLVVQQPYLAAHGERVFRAAAADYGSAFAVGDSGETGESAVVPDTFDAAFLAEFGVRLAQLYELAVRCAEEAIRQNRSQYRLAKRDILRLLREVGAQEPTRTYDALALLPRCRWDEANPDKAEARDWYPWRYNRRLSVTRRPLIQLSTADDPSVLVVPTLLNRTVRYLCEAVSGRLPKEIFDSKEMRSWVGGAVDRDGHEFNHAVAARLQELGWRTRPDLKLTMLGGGNELGDVDVLAWRPDQGLVYAVECKRLLFARTIGEIGERLTEYASRAETGKRTPIQKHLDRMAFLVANPAGLASLTGIPGDQLQIRSALVTDYLVPMQFSARAKEFVDVVSDFALLSEALG